MNRTSYWEDYATNPLHGTGFTVVKLKSLSSKALLPTHFWKAAGKFLNSAGVTYQNQLSWHSCERPTARSLVSGPGEPPYACDSNPHQTRSAERAAWLPSLRPIDVKQAALKIFGTSTEQEFQFQNQPKYNWVSSFDCARIFSISNQKLAFKAQHVNQQVFLCC